MFLYDYYRSLELICKDDIVAGIQKYEDCMMSLSFIRAKSKQLFGKSESEEIDTEERVIGALFMKNSEPFNRKQYLEPREWLNDCALAASTNLELKRTLLWQEACIEYKDLYPGAWKSARKIIEGRFGKG